MRRFGLFALGSLGLFACASLLGDFEVLPAEATTGDDGGTSSDDGSSMADSSSADARSDGAVAPPVPEVVAVNQVATCATAVQEAGTPRERRATFCWGAKHLQRLEYLGALQGDPRPMGFARPRVNKAEVEYLTFDQLYGAGSWFFGRAMKSSLGDKVPFAWGANDVAQCAVKDTLSEPPKFVPTTLLLPRTSTQVPPGPDSGTLPPDRPASRPILGGGAAPFHGCFFDDHRRLYCWGQNDNCEVRSGPRCGNRRCNDALWDPCSSNPGDPRDLVVAQVEDQTDALIGDGGAYRFSRFAGGLEHSCVVRARSGGAELVCWGGNVFRQTGDNSGTPASHVDKPRQVPLPSELKVSADTELAAGDHHTCAIFQSATLVCWGKNSDGQSNPDNTAETVSPTRVVLRQGMGGKIRGLALGGDNSCFIVDPEDNSSRAACFGAVSRWWSDGSARGPISFVPGIKDVQQIAVGSSHACAIARDTGEPSTTPLSLFCWGDNSAEQVDPNHKQQRVVLPRRIELPPIPQ
jgi:hypothetical protein